MSILPKTEEELKALLPQCLDGDLTEIRFDYFHSLNSEFISQHRTKPIIVTVRTKEEGGAFSGSSTEFIRIYQQAIDAGIDYVDISYQVVGKILPRLKFNSRTGFILSCHLQENDIDFLKKTLDEMTLAKADMYKLVFQADSLNDNVTALHLIDYAKKLNIPFVIHAQGEDGKISRTLGCMRGNFWTYVSLTDEEKTAQGQLSINEAKNIFYLNEKTQDARLFGLIGFPVSQSRSWLLFNRLFHLPELDTSSGEEAMNAVYLNFPTEDVAKFWDVWQDRIDGLSVTIPHKEAILKFVDKRSKEVERSGVCNTVLKKDGSWEAYNFDLLAMVELLEPHTQQLKEGTVLIFGTGATTRSAIAALQSLNIQRIFLSGRNGQRGRLLERSFSVTFLESHSDLPNLSAIIQTTPVGMYPNVEEMPSCVQLLRKGMIVLDVVPNPRVTRFLKAAREMGCVTLLGEEMYLNQAAKQFELFTGNAISMNLLQRIWNKLLEQTPF